MQSSKEYSSKIVNASEELSVKDRIKKKEISGALRIDRVLDSTEGETITCQSLTFWAELAIHNEHSDNVDYSVYLYEFADGSSLVTSSESCNRSFQDLKEELEADGESIIGCDLTFFRRASKNPKNKGFVLCNLA